MFQNILNYLPAVFWSAILAAAAIFYARGRNFKALAGAAVGFRIIYATAQTIYQYYDWKAGALTKLLLPPYQPADYLLFYGWGRFWLNAAIAIGLAAAFYVFLKILQKHKERFFVAGETELGGLVALVVGWPNFVPFLPAVFAGVVLISAFRTLVLKRYYTTLGWPLIFAAILAMLFGSRLIQLLDWNVLKI